MSFGLVKQDSKNILDIEKTRFFYKQNFYKQRQGETGKKLSKS